MKSTILCGNCLDMLKNGELPKAEIVFADPPDNLGLKYAGGVTDKVPYPNYLNWLSEITVQVLKGNPKVFWLSHYYKHSLPIMVNLCLWATDSDYIELLRPWQIRLFFWRFGFGQHQTRDCGNGYRPIFRFSKPGTLWDTNAIRIPSARAKKYHDARADPRGRVPDDIWDFPRVCGNFKERRPWHPCQHPEALMERILKLSGGATYSVLDLFGGTFTTDRVCRRLGMDCTSVEISKEFCNKYLTEAGEPAII